MKRAQKRNGRLRFCLLGASLDVGNMGVRALAISLVQLIKDSQTDPEIYFLYGNASRRRTKIIVKGGAVEAEIINYRLSPRASLREHLLWIVLMAIVHRALPNKMVRSFVRRSTPWLNTLLEADFIGDICGGDSFSDIYGLRRFFLGRIPAMVVLILRKELILLPQTFGPFKFTISKLLARKILDRASKIYCRDRVSLEVVRGLVGPEPLGAGTVEFCPDVAFFLEARKPDYLDIQPSLDCPRDYSLAGINISGLLWMGGYNQNNMFGLRSEYKELMRVIVSGLLKLADTHLLLIPHVFSPVQGDLPACKELWECLTEKERIRVHVVNREYDQSELKWIIGQCDFFIGSRMHSCIAALSQGIPTIGLAYSRKFRGVFQSVGVTDMVIDMTKCDIEAILEKCVRRFENRRSVASVLASELPKVEGDLRNIFKSSLACDLAPRRML